MKLVVVSVGTYKFKDNTVLYNYLFVLLYKIPYLYEIGCCKGRNVQI